MSQAVNWLKRQHKCAPANGNEHRNTATPCFCWNDSRMNSKNIAAVVVKRTVRDTSLLIFLTTFDFQDSKVFNLLAYMPNCAVGLCKLVVELPCDGEILRSIKNLQRFSLKFHNQSMRSRLLKGLKIPSHFRK